MEAKLGTFKSARWGQVTVYKGEYLHKGGPTAIWLTTGPTHEPLAKLSVNLEGLSENLPKAQFFAKTYSENEGIAREALASGLFRVVNPSAVIRGHEVVFPLWEIIEN